MNVVLPAMLMIIHLTYVTHLYAVLSKLENCADSLFTWFKENHMKPNSDKCHLPVTTEKSVSINFGGSSVKKQRLGIKFD